MNILDHSIQRVGGVGRLAKELDVRQNVVSNWRARGIPKPWEQVLRLKYGATQDVQGSANQPNLAVSPVDGAGAAAENVVQEA